MQTQQVIIHGSYYDSQIYSGRLYLWSSGGTIITVDWDRLIENLEVEARFKFALRCAFLQSEYLYGDDFKRFFQDDEIKEVLKQKFRGLAERPIELSESDLRRLNLIIAEQDNPLPFPHADSLIYNKALYIGGPSGISATTFVQKDVPISQESSKLWDGPVLAIAASYSTLALAAGSEGLFQRSSSIAFKPREQVSPIINKHSNSARWMYQSIFSSSYFNDGYLAHFTLEQAEKDRLFEEAGVDREEVIWVGGEPKERKLQGVISADSIFEDVKKGNAVKYTWGMHDKICLATPEYIDIVQYFPWRKRKRLLEPLGRVDIRDLPGDIIRGDSALFGYIVELEDGLLVVDSDGEGSTWLQGEPVNWRIFPRSKYYTNQLHVVYDEYLCIHSFNLDYFVNQKKKRVGIRHSKSFSP